MERIDVKQLNDNVFETIGKEWLLVCSGDKENFNMMTASWGCLGWLWNKPVAVVFIRPERHTHELIEKNEYMTLSFLGHSEEARKIYNFCGSKSGRDFIRRRKQAWFLWRQRMVVSASNRLALPWNAANSTRTA